MRPIQIFLVQEDLEALVSKNTLWIDALSPPDSEQFERFKHSGARAQFLTGRWLMRHVLEEAGFAWGDVDRSHEKFTHPDAHFNLSHVDGLVGLALDLDSPIGFDVEWLRRGTNRAQLMPRQFVAKEIEWVASAVSDDEHRERFFRLWTVKEAILKAEACGLRVDTRTMVADIEAGVVRTAFERTWDVYSARLGDHVLSLATPTSPREVVVKVLGPEGWRPQTVEMELLSAAKRGV